MNNNTLIAGFEDIMTHIKNQEIRIKKLTAAKEEVDKLYYTEYNGKTYEPWELKEENEKLKEQYRGQLNHTRRRIEALQTTNQPILAENLKLKEMDKLNCGLIKCLNERNRALKKKYKEDAQGCTCCDQAQWDQM